MPQLGETVTEGKVTKWFKSAGDAVKPGDKVTVVVNPMKDGRAGGALIRITRGRPPPRPTRTEKLAAMNTIAANSAGMARRV